MVGTIAVTTVAGVLFAWLRLRSGSLVAPILAHIATNSFAYVGALVALAALSYLSSTISRSRCVFSAVQPGGWMIAAHASTGFAP